MINTDLADTVFERDTKECAAQLRRINLDLLMKLAAIKSRGIHLARGYSSLFSYCVGELRLSESSAYRRTACIEAVEKYPLARQLYEAGEINLCTLALVAKKLTEKQHHRILSEIRGKSKADVEAYLAAQGEAKVKPRRSEVIRVIGPVAPAAEQGGMQKELTFTNGMIDGPRRVEGTNCKPQTSTFTSSEIAKARQLERSYTFRGGEEFHKKLEHARNLLSHQIPDGSLGKIFDYALNLVLKKKDPTRARPSKNKMHKRTQSRYVQRSTRKEVFQRDEHRCTFTDQVTGRRCENRRFLHLDHIVPFSLVGTSSDPADNRVLCAQHNQYMRKKILGR